MAQRRDNRKLGDRVKSLFTVSSALSLLAGVPSNLATVRKFVSAVDWRAAQEEIAGELEGKIAIVGMPNSGKSTLFNTLEGKYRSFVSTEAGATTGFVRGSFGPFALIDTPGHLHAMQDEAIHEATAVLYLIDATQGVRPRDAEVIQRLRDGEKPFVVALNKTDLVAGDVDEAAAHVAARLRVPDVTPISGQTGDNVAEELIPALINTSPETALMLGRLLPEYRRKAANKLVRSATLISLAAGLQPIPLVDIPILLSNQVRMTLRVAAVYGEPVTAQHLRELIATVAGGLAMRYLAEEAAKLAPFGGDLISGAIAAAGTYALGQVAIEYFERGKQLSSKQINELFRGYYRRYREEHPSDKPAPALPSPSNPATASDIGGEA
ncbi:MAG TPA: GTP-binding protein [Ktedonobacterales bacterium]|nr:GTP-binding protein [Ktedonobacterales bacterium]